MKHPAEAPGPRYESSLELLRLSEVLWNASRVFLARWDLSPSQFNILNLLYGQVAGCTQIELSRRLITHRSNVTGLVDRLASRGLVGRQNVPNDRRAFNVVLTPAGRSLVRRIQPHYHEAVERIWGDLTADDARALVTRLAAVAENAERIARAGHGEAGFDHDNQGGPHARDA